MFVSLNHTATAFVKALFLPVFLFVTTITVFPFGQMTNAPPAQTEFVLGTVCRVNLYAQGSAKMYHELFSRIREIENLMSANKTDTELDLINRNAGIKPVPVHGELITVLERALYYAELSGGAFDPTVGPLVKLWDIGSESPRLPEPEEIREALSLINWRDMVIDQDAGTVFLKRPGMALDLGAIAKGYAVDEAVRIVAHSRIPGAIIDLGGDVFAYGKKEGTHSWRIGIQNPLKERGTYIGILEVQNKTIVTSGVYERYAEINGKQYHHILSTKDGYPVDNGLLSVTVVADSSMDADALSTAVFTLGYEKGRALIEATDNTEVIFIFEDKRIRLTRGAKGIFTLTDTAYRLED